MGPITDQREACWMQPSIVDVDEPDTWPAQVRSRAEELALDHLDTTPEVSELSIPLEGEDDFRRLFKGRRLLTYHATPLFPHEVEWIRSVGLLLATEELVLSRLSRALEAQLIDQPLHDALVMGNVFADRDADNREGQICLVLSRKPFDCRPRGFHYLLSEWGGELITMSKGGANVRSLLQQLGTPSIVVAEVNLGKTPMNTMSTRHSSTRLWGAYRD